MNSKPHQLIDTAPDYTGVSDALVGYINQLRSRCTMLEREWSASNERLWKYENQGAPVNQAAPDVPITASAPVEHKSNPFGETADQMIDSLRKQIEYLCDDNNILRNTLSISYQNDHRDRQLADVRAKNAELETKNRELEKRVLEGLNHHGTSETLRSNNKELQGQVEWLEGVVRDWTIPREQAGKPNSLGVMTQTILGYQREVLETAEIIWGEVALHKLERAARFYEEATELMQAVGLSKIMTQHILDYVYSRKVGNVPQEVGGTMIGLAALCELMKISMWGVGLAELDRLKAGDHDKFREKQRAKPISIRPSAWGVGATR